MKTRAKTSKPQVERKTAELNAYLRRAFHTAENWRVAKRWHTAATRSAGQLGRIAAGGLWKREAKPRSRRVCVDCAQPYRAVWISSYRAYCERCGECILVKELEKHPQEIADIVLGFFTPDELARGFSLAR
jgi:DNA-directed RNA polymerase subunit RPC12/RpoP